MGGGGRVRNYSFSKAHLIHHPFPIPRPLVRDYVILLYPSTSLGTTGGTVPKIKPFDANGRDVTCDLWRLWQTQSVRIRG